MSLTESRQKALSTAQELFLAASGNLLYQRWRASAIESFAFFDGEGQYHPNVLKILEERGQSPIVVNKVRSMINQASGLEINTRGKIAFRPQSNSEEEEKLTKAMTHYAFAVQKEQGFSFKGSLRCRDALICGLGWSRMFPYRNQILYDYTHPLNVIFDADDFSPQLTNMQHLINLRYLTPDQVKSEWTKVSKQIDQIASRDAMFNNVGNFTTELFNRNSSFLASSSSNGSNGSRLLVAEVMQKQKRKYYCGIDKNGYYFETFKEEEAEKLADKKSDIEEEMGTQIMRTVFCDDILLDYAPMFPNIPNRSDFVDIPLVWQRRTSDAMPVGWMEDIKDLQRELNYRKLREILSLNSKTAIIDSSAFHGQDMEEIRNQIARDDAILIKTGPGEVNIMPNASISAAMIQASERIDHELQQVSGMYSDSMGDATNATSGVAIKQRQIGTSKNLAFGFDAFNYVKEREGKVLIDLLQGSGLENILVNIVMDDEEKEIFIMNLVREIDGKQHVFNDIRTLPVDIYVEIVPDYDSSFEEQRSTLETLLANPQAPLILQNPYLLKILLGERHADKIAEAMQQLNQQQNEQQAISSGGRAAVPESPQDMNPTQFGAI
jgi:hypothetical protein